MNISNSWARFSSLGFRNEEGGAGKFRLIVGLDLAAHVIDIFAEERGHDGAGNPLGRDIDARDIAGDAGMACMGAEIDQMDLAEGWLAARRLLGQFEAGTQMGKPLQIRGGGDQVRADSDRTRWRCWGRSCASSGISAGSTLKPVPTIRKSCILASSWPAIFTATFPSAREAVSIPARKWIWKSLSLVVRLTVSCGTGA